MSPSVKTVVFPVAGLGTRFLPATKVIPKEMLPVVDKPLIQYAVEEALAAGARKLVFVTGRTKAAIADHFDMAYELETELEKRGKQELLALVENILPDGVECVYVRQRQALGLGHAVLCAAPVVDDEFFGIILPDDLIDHPSDPAMVQLGQHCADTGASVISVREVPTEQTASYGVVEVDGFEGSSGRLQGIVEKPDPSNAPSNLAVVGRYLLNRRIFDLLRSTRPDHRGEIQVTDAIAELLRVEKVDAYRFRGMHYDCGSKLGFLQATVALGRHHAEVGPAFDAWLETQDSQV